MGHLRKPPSGARVQVNVACPFNSKDQPVWITATVTELLSTQFVWEGNGEGSDRSGICFYAHYDELWRFADEMV